MDLVERIVYGIIVFTFLSLFATFYLAEAQSKMPYPEYLHGPIEAVAGITIFLIVLGFAMLLINRRTNKSSYS
jgi:nitrate reductase gamma subunit